MHAAVEHTKNNIIIRIFVFADKLDVSKKRGLVYQPFHGDTSGFVNMNLLKKILLP
jgi:hypothetical protein